MHNDILQLYMGNHLCNHTKTLPIGNSPPWSIITLKYCMMLTEMNLLTFSGLNSFSKFLHFSKILFIQQGITRGVTLSKRNH